MTAILNSVPFGQSHALSAREIWRRVDCDSEMSVQHDLNNLAESGAIKRERQDIHGSSFRWIYYRVGSA